MYQYRRLNRSIRLETAEIAIDVWPSEEAWGRVWKYTVFDYRTRTYIDNGNASSEDEACMIAEKVAGL